MTNLEDANLACELGADAVGFIFYERSPRFIQPEKAYPIMCSMPPFVAKVGVFVNMPFTDLIRTLDALHIDVVQLHGEESPEYCSRLKRPCLKVFRVGQNFNVEILQKYRVAGFLLDTFEPARYGGTGKSFDWLIAKQAKKYGRIVLSGGLKPENILEAIQASQPYAVDTCSGVEASPGKKDPEKMEAFLTRVHLGEVKEKSSFT